MWERGRKVFESKKTEAGRSKAGELLRYKRGKVQWEDMMDSTGPRNIVAIDIQKSQKNTNGKATGKK